MLKIYMALLLVTWVSLVQAQNKPRTVLWQVHKPGTPHTSYLFGTFHEVNGLYFASLTASAKQLAQAEVLYVERRSDAMAQDEKTVQKTVLWNAPRWQALLTSPQQALFARFVQKAEDSSYYRYSPLLLRLGLFKLYGQNFCDTLDRTSGELLDQYIERQALVRQIPVKSLDAISDRTNAFSPTSNWQSEAEHATYCIDLMQAMLNDDHSKCGFVQAYKNFDLDYAFEQSGHNRLGLRERNTKWLAILDNAFRKRSCFVAVGFQHLMYQQGLIQQLRQRGYRVTPVPAR